MTAAPDITPEREQVLRAIEYETALMANLPSPGVHRVAIQYRVERSPGKWPPVVRGVIPPVKYLVGQGLIIRTAPSCVALTQRGRDWLAANPRLPAPTIARSLAAAASAAGVSAAAMALGDD